MPAAGAHGPQVFIAHAGEQKQSFVDVLRVLLRDVHALDVFVDEWSLLPNDDALDVIQENLRSAAVGKRCVIWSLPVQVDEFDASYSEETTEDSFNCLKPAMPIGWCTPQDRI